MTKQLNKTDQYIAENQYKANEHYNKALRLSRKMIKAEASGKSSKVEKYGAKMQAHSVAGREFLKRVEKGQAITNMVLKNAPALGYDISTSRTMRHVEKGRTAVTAMLSGGGLYSASYVVGTKYKVREKK